MYNISFTSILKNNINIFNNNNNNAIFDNLHYNTLYPYEFNEFNISTGNIYDISNQYHDYIHHNINAINEDVGEWIKIILPEEICLKNIHIYAVEDDDIPFDNSCDIKIYGMKYSEIYNDNTNIINNLVVNYFLFPGYSSLNNIIKIIIFWFPIKIVSKFI